MNKLTTRAATTPQSGFNLIEIAIALVIISVLLVASLNVYKQHENQRAAQTTEDNMRIVVNALSTYVQTHNRLPCPADPSASGERFGFEAGALPATISGGRPPGNCTGSNQSGLVPYQVINVPHEAIVDGWGRYMSYGVSPIFTLKNEDFRDVYTINTEQPTLPFADSQDDGDTQPVHRKCREAGWVNADEDAANGPKARFCCAFSDTISSSSDLRIVNRDNGQTVSPSRAGNTNVVYTEAPNLKRARMNMVYRTDASKMPLVSTPGQDFDGDGTVEGEVEAAAFALVSHGTNGYCAYMADNSNARLNCASPASANEIANGSGSTFYMGERKNDFDDIVVWTTQFGLMAWRGANSCNLP